MPDGAAPQSVVSLGGRFGYQDQGQTPNTQLTMFDFGDVKLICEQRGLVARKAAKVTVEFHTDEGVVKDGKFFPKGEATGRADRRTLRSAGSPNSGGSTSATSSIASAAGNARTSTPKSSKDIGPRCWPTWATSRTAWAKTSPSTSKRRPSATTSWPAKRSRT